MHYFDEILYLSKRLLRYPSINGHGGTDQDAVFGKTIVACQKDMLEYCESIGMITYMDPQGMYSYAQSHPGDDYIALLTHLDVVAAGDEDHWEHPPFDPTIVEDKLVARGAADDKVPAAIAVLAVKKLMDEGDNLRYPVRIIFGGDEETGFRCINKYKITHHPPKYTLVLDGTFPFSFSEKHLLNYELHVSTDIQISGGVGYNSVMDQVVWTHQGQDHVVSGRSAHASRPRRGENALIKLAYMNKGVDKLFELVNNLVEPDGHHKIAFIEDPGHFDDTTLCFGQVKNEVIYTDVRVPPDMPLDAFKQDFERWVKAMGVTPVLTDQLSGSITATDTTFAQTVLKCYRDITGDFESQPFKTGSATYGRSFETNCLSFGPRMPYHITNTHKPNEFIPFDLIENAFDVYVHTLKIIEEEL